MSLHRAEVRQGLLVLAYQLHHSFLQLESLDGLRQLLRIRGDLTAQDAKDQTALRRSPLPIFA